MAKKTLSIFVDESGDFGEYRSHSPYYCISMILHEQSISINDSVQSLKTHISYLGYEPHAIHTGPLIRRESFYINDLLEMRKTLFNALFHFTRKININYLSLIINKYEFRNQEQIVLMNKLSKSIFDLLKNNYEYIAKFDSILVYYDNGQVELTKILTSVFNSIFSNVGFRRVRPIDYTLFQVADLVCTIELLSKKSETNSFTKSELEFFGSIRNFKKNIYKQLIKKKL